MLTKVVLYTQEKVSSYMAQYPVLGIAESTFLPWQTCSIKPQLINFSAKLPAMLQLMREWCSYKYPPLSIARYSIMHLSELER